MTINKQIPQADWKDFFVTFSNGNRGREISLEVFDSESGDLGPANRDPSWPWTTILSPKATTSS